METRTFDYKGYRLVATVTEDTKLGGVNYTEKLYDGDEVIDESGYTAPRGAEAETLFKAGEAKFRADIDEFAG